MRFSNTIYNQILHEPKKAIEEFDLVYTNPKQLSIIRKQENETFIYLKNNKTVTSSLDLKRITSLVIPPAWNNVNISELENGHLQVVGRDTKNRKQYKYHPKWIKIRKSTKFYKILFFAKHLPNIREAVDNDLNQSNWTETKVLALIIRLLEETHIRIGNSQYAKRNKTYGLSTLRTKHVNTYKDKINFEFVGKKGKEHKVSIRNIKLIYLIQKCEEIPGWELFQYFNANGQKQSVDSSLVNAYLKSISGSFFTAKDFRTWSATKIAFLKLYELGLTNNKSLKSKNIITALDTSAKALGNTRNVCKTYYVHPVVIESYTNNSIATYFDKISETKDKPNFTSAEQALYNLLESYNPLEA